MFEIGNSLREARVRQKLDFAEAERATKIRGKYLRALEDEQFDVLPAETYVKGFLRTYADYLGLDGQLYVDEYNSRHASGEEEPPLRARRSADLGRNRQVETNAILVALSAIGLLTALVIAAWKFGDPNDGERAIPDFTPPAQTAQRARPVARPERRAFRRPRSATLVVTAAFDDCWLQVRRGAPTGAELYQGTLLRGRTLRFRERRLWINVGRPGVLRLTLNGKRRALTGTEPQIVVVTPAGIRRAPPLG